MTDLLFDGANNPAGNFLVRFVPVVGVAILPTPAPSGPNAGSIGSPTFVTGYRWFTAYGTDETKSIEEEQKLDDNGSVWAIAIQAWLPGDSAQRRLQLAEMVRHRFLVAVEDNIGLVRVFGTKVESLQFTYRFQVDKQMGGRRGYLISFSGSSTSPAPILL
ncbi:hypothetical protein G8759_31255 [Spirosoma aureum]|uniref:Phage tail protein n=1 Tax=Spirosoma aureum TaxID=2692134 RepID=A0A6G9AWF2_9BACT|nr:hypothetical protein [Spirosoma aureum]QIP16802.1 hypothetical protein G8759_31255 [Spirosoma aureum]